RDFHVTGVQTCALRSVAVDVGVELEAPAVAADLDGGPGIVAARRLVEALGDRALGRAIEGAPRRVAVVVTERRVQLLDAGRLGRIPRGRRGQPGAQHLAIARDRDDAIEGDAVLVGEAARDRLADGRRILGEGALVNRN